MNNESPNYSWSDFPKEVQSKIMEKMNYEKRLGELLEDIRQAALGIDYQTKVHLRMVEKRVLTKLAQTESEIRQIFKDEVAKLAREKNQGTLFDV
ncbi:MAG: hypothetical protein RL176_610 [Pseudomonadota bacterium]|jgi:ABC-type uncharacterized transport system auxiliary subunit